MLVFYTIQKKIFFGRLENNVLGVKNFQQLISLCPICSWFSNGIQSDNDKDTVHTNSIVFKLEFTKTRICFDNALTG